MILERKAPAKINLGLHVLRRREDGYHDIETVLVRIGLHDRLHISHSDSFSFSCSDPTLPVNEDNLCVKAVHLLARQFNVEPKVALHLEKNVPYGAGLGGGSSDAAYTLLMVNEYLALGASDQELHKMASTLGSDVPFFLGGPASLGSGRGEVLTPVRQNEGAGFQLGYSLLLVVPPVHVSTKEAYQYVAPNDVSRPDLVDLVLSDDLEAWRSTLVNDFEASVFKTYPEIGELKDHLYQSGALYASMSGSGSSVFGLFDNEQKCQSVAKNLRSKRIRVWTEGPQ